MKSNQVLVVDDDPRMRIALGQLFADAGFSVALATDGVEAIDWLDRHETPCAIVLDLLMPGIVGQELLDHVQSDPVLRGVPIAIISGSPQLAPPGYRVFAKPVDHAELLEFVRSEMRQESAAAGQR